jgi:hypothetical protein
MVTALYKQLTTRTRTQGKLKSNPMWLINAGLGTMAIRPEFFALLYQGL